MSLSGGHFLSSEDGSLAPILAIMLIPMCAALGISVDYNAAIETRASMQNALDAAALSITTLPTSTSLADRQVKLQESFAANSGQGTAKLDSFVVAADGTASIDASARFAMPTNFLQIARIDTVKIGVKSAARKRPALVQTTFKVDLVSGHWDKTMTLYGTKFGETAVNPLMKITYAYNDFGDPKGYGTSTVYTVNGSTNTKVQEQKCTTKTVKNFNSLPTGAITQVSGSKRYLTTCTNTMYPANGAGAVVDVSLMDTLYLQMDVPSAQLTRLKSNDPNTSNRLYIDDVEVANGEKVDIFTAVPCGQPSQQAWEDGGNAVPAPVSNADFFYTVTGRCDFNQRPSETVLTQ
ncbi:pilus assembly protein [Mesorhizobium sp. M9A.F.Ca.ET.002.03.1.2]|uniref:TadE/TadG family type IV pilus assembly protein n=1 Tax=Mesorhizobium sp. M9A.F.Ca.ET.002.03.1.2 TaxID=2493668 RepID=UPI000F7538AA|nr:TadE/TadG family type IV pilus assembly protein [Mesorhizobium sp. M9A.F.Ca.ET.002.03.1.2]AZN97178.1 pilus assembly protein [Mesorhizobium sp. M9A.F.Ca.ET.002.03.1.2]